MIMHMFTAPLRLTWNDSRPVGQNEPLRAAQKVAGTELGNQWKNIFIAQIRLSREQHDLFYLTTNEAQNAVVRQAVNNGFNPTSHFINKRWEIAPRAGERER